MSKYRLEKPTSLIEQQSNQSCDAKKETLDRPIDKIFFHRSVIGLHILRNRMQAYFLDNKSPKLLDLDKLIGNDINRPSQFLIQLQKDYLFEQQEKNLVFSLKDKFQRWFSKNKSVNKLHGQQLRIWKIKGIKRINKWFKQMVSQLDYRDDYYVSKKIKQINQYVNQATNQIENIKNTRLKERFVHLLNLLDERFQKEGYQLSIPVANNLFKRLRRDYCSDENKSKYNLTLQLQQLKIAKEKVSLTPEKIRQQLHKLMELFAQQQDGLANVAASIESLLNSNKDVSFKEIWQIVEQGGKKYYFDEEQYAQFYEKIYLLLQQRQIIQSYITDYQQRFANRWQEHFFVDIFGFQPREQMVVMAGATNLNFVCADQNDCQQMHTLISKRKKQSSFKTTVGMYCSKADLLPRLNDIVIINGHLLENEQELEETIIHEEQHFLWSKLYSLEAHLLTSHQLAYYVDLKNKINNLMTKNKSKSKNKLLEIVSSFSKKTIEQVAEIHRILIRDEILAYYKDGAFIQDGVFSSKRLKQYLLESSSYDYLIDQEDDIDDCKQFIIEEVVKSNPEIEVKLLNKAIDKGIKKGKVGYYKIYKHYVDLDIGVLNAIDTFYLGKRNKVTILLSFNPNWQLLARRLKDFEEDLIED